MIKCYRNFYIVLLFLVCLSSVYGFNSNNGNFVLHKATLGAKVFTGNNTEYNITSTILTPPVGNSTGTLGEICIGWYCIIPSEGVVVTVAEVVEEITGGVGAAGGCPAGYNLVLYEGSYFCANDETLIRFRQRRYNLYLIICLFILFFIFKRKSKKKKEIIQRRYYGH